MERSIASHIIGSLHLMLRIILGIGMLYAAVMTVSAMTLLILLSELIMPGKGPSISESPMIWPMLIVISGAIPSAAAALILTFKNKVASRNPRETAFAITNVLSAFLFQGPIFSVEALDDTAFNMIVATLTALLYCASAAMVIVVARRDRISTSVKSGSRLIK